MKENLIKGDEKNLEGRVAVILAPPNKGVLFCSFADSDLDIFRKLTEELCRFGNFPTEPLEPVIKDQSAKEEIFKKFRNNELDLPKNQISIPVYRAGAVIIPRKELESGAIVSVKDPRQLALDGERLISERFNVQSDIYLITEHEYVSSSPGAMKVVIQKMDVAVKEYFMEFQRQLIDSSPTPSKEYRDLIGRPIIQYVTATYLSPMSNAKENGDTLKFNEIMQEFISFGRRTEINRYIREICAKIEHHGNEKKNVDLVELLVKRMDAIHTGNLMDAARYTKRLKESDTGAGDDELKELLNSLQFK